MSEPKSSSRSSSSEGSTLISQKAEQLQTTIRGLLAKAEQSRRFGPAACRAAVHAAIVETITDALEIALQRQMWQPIETAPEDGTMLLMVCDGVWQAYWDGEDWARPDVEGGVLIEPTHWMPLPDPPLSRLHLLEGDRPEREKP